MIEEILSIGPLSLSPFGLFMMLSFVSAYWVLRRHMLSRGLGTEEDASAVIFAAGFGGLLGAKIYYALLYSDWTLLWQRWGFVWYGGFLLGTALVIFTIWRRRLRVWELVDGSALALALGYAVGRVGCFLVGDDYGVPTDLPWATEFPVGLPPSRAGWLRTEFGVDVPSHISDQELMAVHPTQLYETLACLAIFWLGRRLLDRVTLPGLTGLAIVGMLGVERFFVEFVRAKDDRVFGAFTVAQIISLCVIVSVVAIAYWRRASAQFDESAAGHQPASASRGK